MEQAVTASDRTTQRERGMIRVLLRFYMGAADERNKKNEHTIVRFVMSSLPQRCGVKVCVLTIAVESKTGQGPVIRTTVCWNRLLV